MHGTLRDWSSRLLADAPKTGLPTGHVASHALVQIYEDLQRVIQGGEVEELTPLLQSRVLPRDQKAPLSFPVLTEVFNTLEEVLLDRLMRPKVPFEPLAIRIAFEKLSHALHLILDSQVNAFCGCCIGELAAACTRFARKRMCNSMEELDALLSSVSTQPPVERTGAIHATSVASIRLVSILHDRSDEIRRRWLEEVADDPMYQGQSHLAETVQNLFDAVIDTAMGMRFNAVDLPGGLPHQSGHRALRLCHVGEEVMALDLIQRADQVHVPTILVRAALNRVFHQLVRSNCIVSCSGCRARLDQAKNVLASMERTISDLRTPSVST